MFNSAPSGGSWTGISHLPPPPHFAIAFACVFWPAQFRRRSEVQPVQAAPGAQECCRCRLLLRPLLHRRLLRRQVTEPLHAAVPRPPEPPLPSLRVIRAKAL